jgi:hypothetical protein
MPVRSIPIYPTVAALAIFLAYFTASIATVQALPRPLVVAVLVVLVLQAIATVVVRDRDRGAFLATIVLLVLTDLIPLAVLVAAAPVGVMLIRRVVGRRAPIDWRRLTEILNIVAVLLVVQTVASGWLAGAFGPPVAPTRVVDARAAAPGPDLYLIMLDGYPRADTLTTEFAFDNAPFLASMTNLGFDVASKAHSNYSVTNLTLASMLNATHIRDLPELAGAPGGVQDQYRAVAGAINRSSALDPLRDRGYEIVTVPSPFTNVMLSSADRVLDSGGVTEFDASLATTLRTRHLLPDPQRRWFSDAIRNRTLAAFDRTAALAGERDGPPKLVFTHVMSPHAPFVFAADGSPVDAGDCFPEMCSVWDSGMDHGTELPRLVAGQVNHLNRLVVDTVSEILAASERPPVIIVFSDHGHRHDWDDHDEMLRSLLLTHTPGEPGLFPDDASPINVIPRIANAYHDAEMPLAGEESYFVDMVTVNNRGPLPVPADPVPTD